MSSIIKENSPAVTEEFTGQRSTSADDPIIPQNKPVIMSNLLATHIQRDYVCAGCYGPLNRYHVFHSRDDRLVCDRCGDGRGFVRKAFANRRIDDSSCEAVEVRQLLRRIGVFPQSRRSTQEILADLGF